MQNMIQEKDNPYSMENVKDRMFGVIEYVKRNKYIKILGIIIILGAVLRYYGIFNAEGTDEYNEVFEALRVASGKFNYERVWKKGYQNILAIEYGIYFIIGYCLDLFKNTMDFAEKIARNLEPLFLIGRYTTATLGTLSVGIVYLIGKKIFNDRVGLMAAAMLAVSTVHVWTSHLVNTDIPLVFFFLLSMFFTVRFYYTGRTFEYVLASFFGAVAINVKLIGVGIGIIFILTHIIRCRKNKVKALNYVYSKEIFWSLVAFIMGLVASNPPIIFSFKKLMAFHYGVYKNIYDEVPYAIGSNAYYDYFLFIYKELGFPLFIVTILSVSYAICRRESWDYILLAFVISTYLVLGGTEFLVQDRYLMIIYIALFILNGRFLDFVVRKFLGIGKARTASLFIVSFCLLAFPFTKSIEYVRTLSEENTSRVSKKWIEANLPANSKILIDAGRTIISSGPRLNDSRENMEKKINVIKNLKKGETYDSPLVKIVDSTSIIYFELLLKNMPQITYDLTTTELGRKVETIEYYTINGYQYVITNSDITWRAYDNRWAEKYPVASRFYRSIDKEFEILKEFKPSPTRSGPAITIYKVK